MLELRPRIKVSVEPSKNYRVVTPKVTEILESPRDVRIDIFYFNALLQSITAAVIAGQLRRISIFAYRAQQKLARRGGKGNMIAMVSTTSLPHPYVTVGRM